MTAIPTTAERVGETTTQIGRPVSRVDGPLKVTGRAKYAGEFNQPGLLHGYVVSGAIARGRITRIDTSAALRLPGVVYVFTHENRPAGLAWFDRSWRDEDAPKGSPFRPLYDGTIHFSMQPIALVVAETFEAARAGARLVHVEYAVAPHQTDLRIKRQDAFTPGKDKGGFEPPPPPRGDADAALAEADVKIDAEYHQATEHHNPLELFASTVLYNDDDTLTIYDKTQGVQNTHTWVTSVFNLPKTSVRVLSPFVGGAFGSGLRPQHQLFLAVLAATQLKRSVRVELSRPQMFSFGHRPETVQRVALGASRDGTLTAMIHEAVQETSQGENYVEIVVNWSGQQYRCENARLGYKLARLDTHTPLDMRAPGAATGVPALEMAVDELAQALRMDPVELRLKNYTDTDPNSGKPFSSKELRACLTQGAQRFGWSRRPTEPRSMRDGRHRVGWGMATGVWDAMQGQASAKARLSADGKLVVGSATADIGTGTYTAMTQIAADTLGLRIEDVTFKLGDSSLPTSPVEGGSWTVSSVGSAVKAACDRVRATVLELVRQVAFEPLASAGDDELMFRDGCVCLKADPSRRVPIAQAMRQTNTPAVEEAARSVPNYARQSKYTLSTHSAVFAEVRVDEELGTIGVSRVVSAVAAGRIINPKTAASQVMGAVVWGVSMGLQEESFMDHGRGRYMNHDLAEYHIPVNADIGAIDVLFVEEHDDVVNPLGAKGVGEIGIVGVPAAIANAVFHATGRRVRDLPITVDKMLRRGKE